MALEWVKKKIDQQELRDLAVRYNIDLLTASVLMRRGITEPAQALYFLEDKELFMHNPFLLPDMDEAVDRILQALEDEEKILVFGDRDTDGVTAEALIASFLIKHRSEPELLLPLDDEPYGLQCGTVEKARELGVTLIICVDNGTSSHEAVALANSYGIDTVIFDHHEPSDEVLPAYACVNPKREGDYPHEGLSASAVVLKALFALNYAQGPFYKRPVCLLHVTNSETEGLAVTVMRVINLKKSNVLRFNLADGPQSEQFLQFIEGSPLYVFNGQQQIGWLSAAFGADVFAEDLAVILSSRLGTAAAMDLENLARKSSMFRFNEESQLMDALFALYNLALLENREMFSDYYDGFALAVIGLLADMMPLTGENRLIVRHGLRALNQPKNSSLTLLLNHMKLLGSPITSKSVNWKISPMFNAAGRMGRADKMLSFLLTTNYEQQAELLTELEALNNERRRLSDYWWEQLQSPLSSSRKKYDGKIIFLYHGNLPRGLTGLLAGRICQMNRQALVIVVAKKGDNNLVGSLRCGTDGLVTDFFKITRELMISHGGHKRAGGFTMPHENLSVLEKKLIKLAEAMPVQEKKADKIYIDAEIPAGLMSTELMAVSERLEPYGENFPALVFATRDSVVASVDLIGKLGEHLKISLDMDGTKWPAFWWSSADNIESLKPGSRLDLLYNVVRDETKSCGLYLNIIDIRRSL